MKRRATTQRSDTPAPAGARGAIPGALAISIAAVLWGFDGVVLTPRLHGLEILFVVFLLHAVPFALMQPFLFRSWAALGRLDARGWGALAAVSLLGGLLGTYAIVRALFAVDFNGLSVVVLLQKLQPVFAIALAALVLGERLGARFLARASAAVAGAYLLTFGTSPPELGAEAGIVVGAAWAVVAAASFGSATVFGKVLLTSLDFREATFARYGLTALAAAVALAVTGGMRWASVTPAQWGLVLLIGVTTGSGALFLYYHGLGRVRAITAAICELWLPLSAVAFDRWLNGAVLSPAQWLGGAILVTAITLVSVDSARRQAAER